MGLCCSKTVIAPKPIAIPPVVIATLDPVTMEQNPMVPPPGRDQPGRDQLIDDEITIVHIVTSDASVKVNDGVEMTVADPTEIRPAIVSAVEETIIVEPAELRRDSTKATCVIERYKEAIGVIEKHPREPTAV